MHGWVHEWVHGWMDGLVGGWADCWVYGWVTGQWVDACLPRRLRRCTLRRATQLKRPGCPGLRRMVDIDIILYVNIDMYA